MGRQVNIARAPYEIRFSGIRSTLNEEENIEKIRPGLDQ